MERKGARTVDNGDEGELELEDEEWVKTGSSRRASNFSRLASLHTSQLFVASRNLRLEPESSDSGLRAHTGFESFRPGDRRPLEQAGASGKDLVAHAAKLDSKRRTRGARRGTCGSFQPQTRWGESWVTTALTDAPVSSPSGSFVLLLVCLSGAWRGNGQMVRMVSTTLSRWCRAVLPHWCLVLARPGFW